MTKDRRTPPRVWVVSDGRAGIENQGSLTDAMLVEPEIIDYLIDALRSLQRLIQTEIIVTLSLTPTFNDGDGD